MGGKREGGRREREREDRDGRGKGEREGGEREDRDGWGKGGRERESKGKKKRGREKLRDCSVQCVNCIMSPKSTE